MRSRRASFRSDRGAIAILAAVFAVVIFGIAALAVDAGAAYNVRRTSQNSADGAALGAAGALPGATPTATSTAIRLSYDGSGESGSMSDWRTQFANCQDPGHLAVVSPDSQCISYSEFSTRVRVRMPNQSISTGFGRVLGFSTLTTNSFAVAGLVYTFSAGVLPFGLLSTAANSTEACLKSSSNGTVPDESPCNGSVDGNFGNLDFAFYGNPALGTPTLCTGSQQDRLAGNMILGVDHPLTVWDGTLREDVDYCTNHGHDQGANPDAAMSQTGNGSALQPGMVTGGAAGSTLANLVGRPLKGRLTNTPYATTSLGGFNLDTKPLWGFIDPTLTTANGIPATCVRSVITNKTQMATCLTDYKAAGSTTPLFTLDADTSTPAVDLQASPRFAYVPVLRETTWGTGNSATYTFQGFQPVFLQTLYYKCNNNSCEHFDPGSAPTGNGNGNLGVQAITAFLLPTNSLPAIINSTAPGTSPGASQIVLFR